MMIAVQVDGIAKGDAYGEDGSHANFRYDACLTAVKNWASVPG